MELQRLADRAGAWFPDEEVGQGHVILDVLSESNHGDRLPGRQVLQLSSELLVVAANQDQLNAAVRFVESPGDVDHHLRAMASEKNNSRRAIGFEPELLSFGDAIYGNLLVELWLQDHSRCQEDMIGGMAHG